VRPAAPVCSELSSCCRCPRLVALREEVREAHPGYHAAPVAPWGSVTARLLIVGLAPGMHGANRTGRPFTGDASGDFLFSALYRAGFASAPAAADARLSGVRITNAVKCLPPGNRPLASEIDACRDYLRAEIATLTGPRPRRNRVVLCLGTIAHASAARCFENAVPDFRHGRKFEVAAHVWLLETYHPSRQNTNTGRLTPSMLDAVLKQAKMLLET